MTTARLAWLGIGGVLAAGALAFGTLQLIGLVAHEELTETSRFDAAGVDVLTVDSDNGSVQIDGRDVDEISVVAEISHGLQRTEHRAEIVEDALEVQADCPILSTWCEVDYRITVPREIDVKVAFSNGRVLVRDVTGTVIADGDNGSIELARTTGDVYLTTDNGSIRGTALRARTIAADTDNGSVALELGEPPAAVTATTDNGSVDLALPDDPVAYRVTVETDNGSTDTAVRTDPGSDRSIVARTDNGDVTVRYLTG